MSRYFPGLFTFCAAGDFLHINLAAFSQTRRSEASQNPGFPKKFNGFKVFLSVEEKK